MKTSIEIEKLGESNYATWSVCMKAYLRTLGLWEAVAGTPASTEADEKALSYLQLSVQPTLLQHISDETSAKNAWNILENLFKSKNKARTRGLRQQLNTLSKLGSETLTEYIARARALYKDLTSAGENVKESEVVSAILVGLPREFNTTVAILEASDDDLSITEVHTKLLVVEQRLRQGENDETKAYIAKGNRFTRRMYKEQSGRPSSRQFDRQREKTCYYCNKVGHIKRDCDLRKKDEARQGRHSFMTAVALTAANGIKTHPTYWAIDSGASRHATPYLNIMSNVKKMEREEPIIFGNNEVAVATHCGTVEFTTTIGNRRTHVRLEDVLYVRDLAANLFSVKQATNRGARVVFEDGKCVISTNHGRLAEAYQHEGLYTLMVQYNGKNGTDVKALVAAVKETPELWHRRLGHMGYTNLSKLLKGNMVDGINLHTKAIEEAKHKVCEPCALGKQTRNPFPTSVTKTTEPLQLVHMDVCGPMEESLGGSRYLATLLDDYSGLSCVIPIKSKDEVADVVPKIMNVLENQAGRKVKIVRTDRGGEYVNHKLSRYFSDKGIIHQKTAPYTSQQNGVAERLNRTIMEKVRSMLADSKRSTKLWAEAAATANVLRNRSPSQGKTKTPWELFFGVKPDISGLRVFGCTAYVQVPAHQRRKLNDVSKKGIFVGYAPNSKAYRILLDDGTIVVSRDVIFDEMDMTDPEADSSKLTKLPFNESEPEEDVTIDSEEEEGNDISEDMPDVAANAESEEVEEVDNQPQAPPPV